MLHKSKRARSEFGMSEMLEMSENFSDMLNMCSGIVGMDEIIEVDNDGNVQHIRNNVVQESGKLQEH